MPQVEQLRVVGNAGWEAVAERTIANVLVDSRAASGIFEQPAVTRVRRRDVEINNAIPCAAEIHAGGQAARCQIAHHRALIEE